MWTDLAADCGWYRELASAEIDGELSPGEDAALAGHLAACADCRGARRRVQRTVRLVRVTMRWSRVATWSAGLTGAAPAR